MHYLVDFINTASEDEINSYLTSFGASILKVFSSFNKVYHIDTPVEPPANSIVESHTRDDDHKLQLLNIMVIADKNYGTIVTDGTYPIVDIPNDDKNWWKYYTLKNPDLNATSYTTNRRGEGSVVYVLDSGIEISHGEFFGTNVQNLFSFNNDFTDTKGHGTAIASIIVGNTCGLTNATVKSVKIFDKNQATKQSDMLNALDAIMLDFQESETKHAVVNCSWSIQKNTYIENKIRFMIDFGICFVAAAGNSGQPIDDVTPAGMDEVITIGSYNNNLKPSNFSAYTDSSISLTQGATNHGILDGWAPGEHIYAAGLNGSYSFTAGTSMAAGVHSSTIAYNMSLTPDNPSQGKTVVEFYSSHSLGRKDMLDLSDVKYQNSVNLISTIADNLPDFGRGAPVIHMTSVIANSPFTLQLFNPKFVSSFEILGSLPENWKLTTNGRMYGTTNEIQNKFSIINFPVLVKYDDTTQENFDFKMLVLGLDFNKDLDKTGDPELDIMLLDNINCDPGGCYTEGEAACIDNCFGLYSCYYQAGGCTKTLSFCQCTF